MWFKSCGQSLALQEVYWPAKLAGRASSPFLLLYRPYHLYFSWQILSLHSDVKLWTTIACAAELRKQATTAAKNPSVLDQACGSTGTLLLGITWPWMLVNIAKITTKCYLSVWTLTEDVLILSASLTNSVSAAGTAWEHTGSYLVWSLCLLEAR